MTESQRVSHFTMSLQRRHLGGGGGAIAGSRKLKIVFCEACLGCVTHMLKEKANLCDDYFVSYK